MAGCFSRHISCNQSGCGFFSLINEGISLLKRRMLVREGWTPGQFEPEGREKEAGASQWSEGKGMGIRGQNCTQQEDEGQAWHALRGKRQGCCNDGNDACPK